MPPRRKYDVTITVTADKEAFERLNKVYTALGLDLLTLLTNEVQASLDSALQSKLAVLSASFEPAKPTPETTPTTFEPTGDTVVVGTSSTKSRRRTTPAVTPEVSQ